MPLQNYSPLRKQPLSQQHLVLLLSVSEPWTLWVSFWLHQRRVYLVCL